MYFKFRKIKLELLASTYDTFPMQYVKKHLLHDFDFLGKVEEGLYYISVTYPPFCVCIFSIVFILSKLGKKTFIPDVSFRIESKHFGDKSELEPMLMSNTGICLPWKTSSTHAQKLSVRLPSFKLIICSCDV